MIGFTTSAKYSPKDLASAEATLDDIKNDSMGGWFSVPTDNAELADIKSAAAKIQSDSDYLVCIGIGGSYLGHRAVIEALGNKSSVKILYAGNSFSTLNLQNVLKEIEGHDFSVNVISKSGTTTEPAIAFRVLKQKLIEKYGKEEASKRIYATTDANKGALHDEAVQNGYTRFVVPDDIGGRYSVLTAVGLLPIAVAGIDIDDLLSGAKLEAEEQQGQKTALEYATYRANLAKDDYDTEILSSFEPEMLYFNEWWKQLFGESEGKDSQGIFPASVICSTDLHSLGQYLQQGRRNILETFLCFKKSYIDLNNTRPDSEKVESIKITELEDNSDGLNYLAGKSMGYVNAKAYSATVAAHRDGGIPVAEIEIPDLSARSLGALIYFFELSCAVSAKLQGVDPFNQPGVETYKTNMFKLLGKPGF